MQFFVDRDTVRMLLSQKEAAQLSLCSQPDCNDPKVCENLSRLLRRAAVSSGRSIPKGEFSVSVCSREQEMEITLTRLGAAQGQRQVWRFWESEQMIQGCICLHRQLCRRTREFPMESSLYAMTGKEGPSSFYCLSLNLPSTWEKKSGVHPAGICTKGQAPAAGAGGACRARGLFGAEKGGGAHCRKLWAFRLKGPVQKKP